MLWTVIAFERFRDRVLAVLHTTMAESSQGQRISFACKDLIQDLETDHSSDVVQDAMNLKVHGVQGLLHVQDVLGGHLNQVAAMSPERSYGADESRWPETGTEQPYRMQVLKPLAIGYVCLPARNVLHVLCVDQIDLESPRLQDLVNGNPANACRLHRHGAYPALHEPVSQRMQIAGKRGKPADGLRVSISADGDVQLAGAHINASSIWMQDRQRVTSPFALLGHLLLQ